MHVGGWGFAAKASTWKFNYWVRLLYSDGTHDEYHFDGHALSEKVRENTFNLR